MLTIDINNAFFALDTGFSVRISWQNPAVYTDKIPGDAGLGINIPVNDINRGILGAPERFAKYFPAGESGVRFAGCSIRFGGALVMSGSLVVKDADNENYDCWLQSDLGVLGEQQQNRNITDLNWPTTQTFDNKETYNDTDDDYGILMINNRGFWDGKGKEVTANEPYLDENGVTKYRNETMSALQKQHFDNFKFNINYLDPDMKVTVTGDGCVVSPFLHLRYVITEALRLNRWYIANNAMYNSETGNNMLIQRGMMIYNNFNIIKATTTTEISPRVTWDEETKTMVEVEVYEITSTTWGVAPFNYKDLLPKISLKDFLLGIQNSLNYIFRFRPGNRVDIIDREAILTGSTIDLQPWVTGLWKMGERVSRRLKFESEVDKDDIYFGSEYEDLTNRLADFGAPVETHTDLLAISSPVIGELRLVIQTNRIYEFKWMAVALETVERAESMIDAMGWEFISNGYQPYIYQPANETEEVIKVPLTTLTQKNTGFFEIWQYNAVQKGNMDQMRSSWSDFTLRAMVNSSILYPDGILWDGPTGLFATRWLNWARFWANRQDAANTFQPPLNVLLYIAENITSKFRTDDGDFIIAEMETEFGLNTIGPTSINVYKI